MKTCENCGVSFSRPVYTRKSGDRKGKEEKCPLKMWKAQRFCSQSCAASTNQKISWKLNHEKRSQNLPLGENHHSTKARKILEAKAEPRTCEWCKQLYYPKAKTRWANWKVQRFCSKSCVAFFAGQNRPVGKDSPRWKGGRSSLNEKIRKLPQYQALRAECFHRDKYTCQEKGCGATGTYLNADHIKPLSVLIELYGLKTLKDARNCPAIWDLTNLRTLCLPCHTLTETYGGRAVRTIHRIPSLIIS